MIKKKTTRSRKPLNLQGIVTRCVINRRIKTPAALTTQMLVFGEVIQSWTFNESFQYVNWFRITGNVFKCPDLFENFLSIFILTYCNCNRKYYNSELGKTTKQLLHQFLRCFIVTSYFRRLLWNHCAVLLYHNLSFLNMVYKK